MKLEKKNLKLPEGPYEANILVIDEKDRNLLYKIYSNWLKLSKDLSKFQTRKLNLPEGLSESALCLEMGFVKLWENIPKVNSSWDCYDLQKKKRIQVKGCSINPDATSFGPNSEWDKLYFLDFFRDGNNDGSFDIYLINNNHIKSTIVNIKKNESFQDQQDQGRRPRFSIFKKIIKPHNIKPIKTAYLKHP